MEPVSANAPSQAPRDHGLQPVGEQALKGTLNFFPLLLQTSARGLPTLYIHWETDKHMCFLNALSLIYASIFWGLQDASFDYVHSVF